MSFLCTVSFFWGVRGEEGSVETVSFGAMKECYLLQKPHC